MQSAFPIGDIGCRDYYCMRQAVGVNPSAPFVSGYFFTGFIVFIIRRMCSSRSVHQRCKSLSWRCVPVCAGLILLKSAPIDSNRLLVWRSIRPSNDALSATSGSHWTTAAIGSRSSVSIKDSAEHVGQSSGARAGFLVGRCQQYVDKQQGGDYMFSLRRSGNLHDDVKTFFTLSLTRALASVS